MASFSPLDGVSSLNNHRPHFSRFAVWERITWRKYGRTLTVISYTPSHKQCGVPNEALLIMAKNVLRSDHVFECLPFIVCMRLLLVLQFTFHWFCRSLMQKGLFVEQGRATESNHDVRDSYDKLKLSHSYTVAEAYRFIYTLLDHVFTTCQA